MKRTKVRSRLNYWPLRMIQIIVLSVLFLMVRIRTDTTKNVVSYFGANFNERKFLGFYLFIFMVGLFPIINNIYQEEIVIRYPNKFQYHMSNLIEIGKSAICYSFTITFCWFFILGTHTKDWNQKGYWIFMITLFFLQCIGWMLIGTLNMLLYIIIRNGPVSFVFCYFIFIVLNLSLYINTSKELEHYIRLYDIMFHPEQIDDILIILSVALFDVFLIFFFTWFGCDRLKRHDFLEKGVEMHAEKKSREV